MEKTQKIGILLMVIGILLTLWQLYTYTPTKTCCIMDCTGTPIVCWNTTIEAPCEINYTLLEGNNTHP